MVGVGLSGSAVIRSRLRIRLMRCRDSINMEPFHCDLQLLGHDARNCGHSGSVEMDRRIEAGSFVGSLGGEFLPEIPGGVTVSGSCVNLPRCEARGAVSLRLKTNEHPPNSTSVGFRKKWSERPPAMAEGPYSIFQVGPPVITV